MYKDSNTFWEAVGTDVANKGTVGGIPYGKDFALVTPEQEQILQSIFETIAAQVNTPFVDYSNNHTLSFGCLRGHFFCRCHSSALMCAQPWQDVTVPNKTSIEAADFAKFIDKRMTNGQHADAAKVASMPTLEECTAAIEESLRLAKDSKKAPEGCTTSTYICFKTAICAKFPQGQNHGSEMCRLLKIALSGSDSFTPTASEQGEMTVGQKLYLYHSFMGNAQSTCREGKPSGQVGKVSLTKMVAQSYCDSVFHEVEALLKRQQAYKQRMRELNPSLRQRTQHQAIDDVFDSENLPGARWA